MLQSPCHKGSAGMASSGVQIMYIQADTVARTGRHKQPCIHAATASATDSYFLPPKVRPPPDLASFLALSAALFSSLALPPLGLFFSDLALGFGLKGSLGGIAASAMQQTAESPSRKLTLICLACRVISPETWSKV